MDYIISNIHYFYYDIEYFFKTVKKSGFDKVEFYTGTPHIFIDGNIIDDFESAFETAHKNGVEIVAIHPETMSFRYSLCRLEKEWNQKSLNAYLNNVEFAAEHGCRYIHTDISGAFKDDDEKSIRSNVVSNLNIIAEKCEENGIVLVLECMSEDNQGYISTINQLRRLINQIEAEVMVGINYSALRTASETLEQWFREFGNQIKYIRVSDLDELENIREYVEKQKLELDIIHYPLDDCFLENPTEYNEKAVLIDGTN